MHSLRLSMFLSLVAVICGITDMRKRLSDDYPSFLGRRRAACLDLRTPINGRLRMRDRGRVARFSCLNGYTLLGEKRLLCRGRSWDQPTPKCIKSGCPLNSTEVANANVEQFYGGALVKFACYSGYVLSGSSVLSCNGAYWNGSFPDCWRTNEEKPTGSCDLERDLCGWENNKNDEFDWKLNTLDTPSGRVGTGPSYDHTLGYGKKGHYLYLEASSPQKENDTAVLTSPYFSAVDSNETVCFVFWYHMYGAATGSLNVYVNDSLNFTEVGNHGNRWIRAVVPVTGNYIFKIKIEGVRGPSYAGDIAIDDFEVAEGSACDQTESLPPLGSCSGRCFTDTITDDNSCYCNEFCQTNSTCCSDFPVICITDVSSATQAGLLPSSSSFNPPAMPKLNNSSTHLQLALTTTQVPLNFTITTSSYPIFSPTRNASILNTNIISSTTLNFKNRTDEYHDINTTIIDKQGQVQNSSILKVNTSIDTYHNVTLVPIRESTHIALVQNKSVDETISNKTFESMNITKIISNLQPQHPSVSSTQTHSATTIDYKSHMENNSSGYEVHPETTTLKTQNSTNTKFETTQKIYLTNKTELYPQSTSVIPNTKEASYQNNSNVTYNESSKSSNMDKTAEGIVNSTLSMQKTSTTTETMELRPVFRTTKLSANLTNTNNINDLATTKPPVIYARDEKLNALLTSIINRHSIGYQQNKLNPSFNEVNSPKIKNEVIQSKYNKSVPNIYFNITSFRDALLNSLKSQNSSISTQIKTYPIHVPLTKSITQSTIKPPTRSTTELTTQSTTELTTQSTTKLTIQPTTKLTTQPTTKLATQPTTKSATQPTTKLTTQPTTKLATQPTTKSATQQTNKLTTQPTTKLTTQSTVKLTTPSTTKLTTQSTTKLTTPSSTTESTTQTTPKLKMARFPIFFITKYPYKTSTQSSVIRTRVDFSGRRMPPAQPRKWRTKFLKDKSGGVEKESHAPYVISEQTDNRKAIVAIVICVSIVGSIVLAIAFFTRSIVLAFVFCTRKLRINRRGAVEDDSDVRFLTSDELINFNLARPSPDRSSAETQK